MGWNGLIGKGDPWPFHLSSILLHVSCAIVVYRLAEEITKERWSALSTALLFVASPVQVESVSWISEQKTVLSGLFYFLAMFQYLRFLSSGSKRSYLMVLIFFVLGALSKATAVMLPVSLLGLVLLSGKTDDLARRWRGLILLTFVALAFGVLAIWAQSHDGYLRADRLGASLTEKCVMAVYALVQYAVRMVLPIHLSALYPIPEELLWYHVAVGFAGMLCALLFVWRPASERRRRIGLLLLFAGPLLPLLQLIPFGEALTADRYAYVACFPVFLLMSKILFRFFGRFQYATTIAITTGCIIISLYAYEAWHRTLLWNDELAMFKNIVERYPDSDIAQFNLATSCLHAGLLPEAGTHFSLATKLDDDYPQAWLGLGTVNASLHNCNLAILNFSKVIRLAHDHPNVFAAYYHRALCYMDQGQPDRARADLREATRRRRDFAPAHYELAQTLAQTGEYRNAISEYSIAMAYGYDEQACRLNRAISLGWLGDNDAAITDLNSVVKIAPENATGWFLRGIAKNRKGESGCEDLERAKELGYPQAGKAIAELCQGTAAAIPPPPAR
jgi:tetratricopeptide (TPR) repeat protein